MFEASHELGWIQPHDRGHDRRCCLEQRLTLGREIRRRGIAGDRMLVDPGLGFAKTPEQSLTLLQRLGEFRSLGLPYCAESVHGIG